MIPKIRKMVSGARIRYEKQGFNLDLTYITDRILAMSFPAAGFQAIYRNHIDTVARFLNEKHAGKYMVYNLSEKTYNEAKFFNRVRDKENVRLRHSFHGKITTLLLSIGYSVSATIFTTSSSDDENVIVVHCNAGKGRTGTAICCFLLYCGFAASATEAISYYGWMRFTNGFGVTQPAQVRYVFYFDAVLKQLVKSPTPKILNQLIIQSVPKSDGKGCRPFFQIYCGMPKKLVFSNKSQTLKYYKAHPNPDTDSLSLIKLMDQKSFMFIGDIEIKLKSKGSYKTNDICRLNFNTSFIPDNNILVFPKNLVDPDACQRDKKLSDYFKVQLIFNDTCDKCNRAAEINQLCLQCLSKAQDQISDWAAINSQVNLQPNFSQQKAIKFLFFGVKQKEIYEKLKYPSKLNLQDFIYQLPSSYRLQQFKNDPQSYQEVKIIREIQRGQRNSYNFVQDQTGFFEELMQTNKDLLQETRSSKEQYSDNEYQGSVQSEQSQEEQYHQEKKVLKSEVKEQDEQECPKVAQQRPDDDLLVKHNGSGPLAVAPQKAS